MVGVDALAFATPYMKSRLIEYLKEWQSRDLLKTCGWMLCCLDVRGPEAAEVAELLRGWDGMAAADSRGAAAFKTRHG